jgi:hypothetical protein
VSFTVWGRELITAWSYRLPLNAFKALYTSTDNCNNDNEDDENNNNDNCHGDASDYDKSTTLEVKRVVERMCDRWFPLGC